MARQKNDILQGTLTLLVLRALEVAGPMHGYAITQHIQRVSAELLRIEEGSLYPALHRMEDDGWLRSSWAASQSLSITCGSGTSVGLPMPRSMMSTPARRLRYFKSLILPNR